MEKIDRLIARIDAEIKRSEESITEGLINGTSHRIIALFDTNIEYLKIFKEMALEVKEED